MSRTSRANASGGDKSSTKGPKAGSAIAPKSLGVAMQGGVFGVIVSRNTPLPTSKSRIFTTVEDNQTTVTFAVYEGEHGSSSRNRLLGEFELTGITAAPRGQAELAVTFEVDASGTLNASATDRTTARWASISLSNSVGRLSSAEIDQMVARADYYQTTLHGRP